ncbi:MAG: DUF2188 domain-containing protein [Candidatus Woesearchaeota archaeon]|jgi:hypothetical protein|nr:DUF2188 domain-containing protein [Candidatus Woesearchaeota archaeon]
MKKKNKHVVPHDIGWAVLTEGKSRASKLFTTKAGALKYAHEVTLRDDLCMFVHDKHGKVSHVKCPRRIAPAILRLFQHKYGLT